MQTSMPFAICRSEKIKTWSSLKKSVGHALRTSKDERHHLNHAVDEPIKVLCGSESWVDDWGKLVANMWLPERQQGTSQTIAREFFLGMSPEWAIGKSKVEIEEWEAANVDWLIERFGRERVKLCVAHRDEQSPHLAAYVVGLKADVNRKGELNSRGNGWTLSDRVLKLGGGKDELVKLQDEYSAAMQKFSLRRGLRKSKAKHQKIEHWRKQMAVPIDKPIIKPRIDPPTPEDRKNVEAYAKRMADKSANSIFEQMKPYHQKAKHQSAELKRLRTLVERFEPIVEIFSKFLMRLLGHRPSFETLQGIKEIGECIDRISPRHQSPNEQIKTEKIDPAKTIKTIKTIEQKRPKMF
jgi:hypothetical protein